MHSVFHALNQLVVTALQITKTAFNVLVRYLSHQVAYYLTAPVRQPITTMPTQLKLNVNNVLHNV
jgi:DNA-directed RNA polymerase